MVSAAVYAKRDGQMQGDTGSHNQNDSVTCTLARWRICGTLFVLLSSWVLQFELLRLRVMFVPSSRRVAAFEPSCLLLVVFVLACSRVTVVCVVMLVLGWCKSDMSVVRAPQFVDGAMRTREPGNNRSADCHKLALVSRFAAWATHREQR